ncbi:MAG: SpoIID/LytB domain-containing protein [Actinomycetes bacterium]
MTTGPGGRRRRRRGVAAACVAGLVWLAAGAPAAAQAAGDGPPVDLGLYGEPLRLEAGESTVFTLPDGSRYAGTIELRRSPDGVLVVNDVSMRTYVEGLAEVPVSWPEAALEAQAIAARTYAWYSIRLASFDGYDICDTVACQVYRGRQHVEAPQGERWAAAVAATEGRVVVDADGGPILARYFSTSGGRTRDNEDVFPSEGAFPYLKAVDDPWDVVSPFHEWRVEFTREEMTEILSRGETLGPSVPFADIELRADPTGVDQVVVTREDGEEFAVSAPDFRSFVSSVAPGVSDRFPTPRADGLRPLPATIPSSRLEFTVTDDAVVVDGRGWGHGVGMSQYGALGGAQQGASAEEILARYYTGVSVASPPDLPDRVRVGLGTLDGPVPLRADGPFRVVAGGSVVAERGLGTWTVAAAPDATLRLTAPEGYGAPLVVAPTTTPRPAPLTVEVVRLETVVNKAAELAVVVTDASGAEVARRPIGVVDAGRHRATWALDDADGRGLAPGTYRVALEATDEDGAAAAEPTEVEVRDVRIPEDAPPSLLGAVPAHAGGAPPVPLLLLAGAGGALVGTVVAKRLSRAQ